jgi:hypothetical protein
MFSIRKNVFETNSSSTHSICICTEEDYKKFRSGDMVYDDWDGKLVDMPASKIESDYSYKSYSDMGQYLEYYSHQFVTPSGDKMVAFGEYGYDG